MTKPFKMLTIAIAGSCLLSFTPALAMAAEATETPAVVTSAPVTAVPISATLPDETKAITITPKLIEESTDLYSAKITLPVISGMVDTAYQDTLNKSIAEQAAKTLDEIKQQAAEEKKSAEENDYPFRPFEMVVQYELKSDGSAAAKDVISFTTLTYTFTGGAHGGSYIETYNVLNTAEASAITLEQALGEGGLASANNAVRYAITQQPELFYTDVWDLFKGVSPEQNFYIEQGIVNLTYQQYDLAPYSSGDINIPVDATTTVGPSTTVSKAQIKAGTNSSTLVPLRAATEKLSYKVTWNNKTQSAEVSRDAQWTSVTVNKNSYIINRMAPLELKVAPTLINGSLYVPVEFYSDILKLEVTANEADDSIKIRG